MSKSTLNSALSALRLRIYDCPFAHTQGNIARRYDTSDIVQESLIQIWQDLEQKENSKEVISEALLKTIVRGHSSKMMRFNLTQKRTVMREVNGQEIESCYATNMQDQLEFEDQVLLLFSAVRHLDGYEKKVIYRRFFEEMAFSEIAAETKLPYHKVRRIYNQAMEKLRHHLEILTKDDKDE